MGTMELASEDDENVVAPYGIGCRRYPGLPLGRVRFKYLQCLEREARK